MNKQICKDCRDEIGPTIVYLRDAIKELRPENEDKGFIAMKQKWLSFFGEDIEKFELQKRIEKIEEDIKILKGGRQQ